MHANRIRCRAWLPGTHRRPEALHAFALQRVCARCDFRRTSPDALRKGAFQPPSVESMPTRTSNPLIPILFVLPLLLRRPARVAMGHQCYLRTKIYSREEVEKFLRGRGGESVKRPWRGALPRRHSCRQQSARAKAVGCRTSCRRTPRHGFHPNWHWTIFEDVVLKIAKNRCRRCFPADAGVISWFRRNLIISPVLPP